jgi:hypothetical protein
MKTRTVITIATLAAFVLGLSAALHAQTAPTPLLRVQVPFEFIAGGMHLPAGQYDILHVGGPNLIMLRSSDGYARALVSVKVSPTRADESTTKLVFNKYGETYFLSQVWTEQDNQVHQCAKGREEEALAAGAPEVVAISAKH